MALNLDSIRKKLSDLQKTNDKKSLQWKAPAGESVVRILPYVHRDDKQSFLELFFYYPPKPPKMPSVCTKTTLSPISFGNPDPIMEFCDIMEVEGSKEAWVTSKKLRPKRRTFMPIIVRGHEKDGVKFWGVPDSLYEELIKLASDFLEDNEDITDLSKGYDLKVSVKKAETEGAFDKTSVRAERKSTAATTDKDIAELIKKMPEITELYPEPSYESLKQQLEVWIKSSDETNEEEDVSTPVTRGSLKTVASTVAAEDDVEPSIPNLDDMEQEFDDLFKEN